MRVRVRVRHSQTVRASRKLTSALLVVACWATPPAAARADGCPDPAQTIITDRPSVTNSSTVVPDASLQLENGLNWTTRPGQDTLDGTNTRLRLGLAGCTELLVDLPDFTGGIEGRGATGFSGVAPAIKHQFAALPAGTNLSLTAGVALPTGAKSISGTGYSPYLQLPWTQDLGGGWTAGGMLSALWRSFGPETGTVAQPSILLDRQAGSKADVFVEAIAIYQTHGVAQQLLNAGGSYRLTPTQQIDVHVGFGVGETTPYTFIGIGYSIRLDRLW